MVPGRCYWRRKSETRPKKLEAVNNYPKPVCKKDVRAFLGLTGYYRRFVPHFATIAEPLTELTKGKNPDQVK